MSQKKDPCKGYKYGDDVYDKNKDAINNFIADLPLQPNWDVILLDSKCLRTTMKLLDKNPERKILIFEYNECERKLQIAKKDSLDMRTVEIKGGDVFVGINKENLNNVGILYLDLTWPDLTCEQLKILGQRSETMPNNSWLLVTLSTRTKSVKCKKYDNNARNRKAESNVDRLYRELNSNIFQLYGYLKYNQMSNKTMTMQFCVFKKTPPSINHIPIIYRLEYSDGEPVEDEIGAYVDISTGGCRYGKTDISLKYDENVKDRIIKYEEDYRKNYKIHYTENFPEFSRSEKKGIANIISSLRRGETIYYYNLDDEFKNIIDAKNKTVEIKPGIGTMRGFILLNMHGKIMDCGRIEEIKEIAENNGGISIIDSYQLPILSCPSKSNIDNVLLKNGFYYWGYYEKYDESGKYDEYLRFVIFYKPDGTDNTILRYTINSNGVHNETYDDLEKYKKLVQTRYVNYRNPNYKEEEERGVRHHPSDSEDEEDEE